LALVTAADASFVLVQSCVLSDVVTALDERGYRAVQTAAGLTVGALGLACAAQGLDCCALTLCDAVLPDLFGRHDAAGLLAVAVGRQRSDRTHHAEL
jgi:hypothetical protein